MPICSLYVAYTYIYLPEVEIWNLIPDSTERSGRLSSDPALLPPVKNWETLPDPSFISSPSSIWWTSSCFSSFLGVFLQTFQDGTVSYIHTQNNTMCTHQHMPHVCSHIRKLEQRYMYLLFESKSHVKYFLLDGTFVGTFWKWVFNEKGFKNKCCEDATHKKKNI